MSKDQNEKIVTFRIGTEYFAISIKQVMSIEKMSNITAAPDMPNYVRGILNLRGMVIPIVDLRHFLLKKVQRDEDINRIIIVNIENTQVGVIVDEATEVLDIPANILQHVSIAGNELNKYMQVAQIGDRLVMIMDISQLILNSEIADDLKKMASQ